MAEEYAFADPGTMPDLYNYAIIDGIITPGQIAEMTGGGRSFKWDKKDAKGKAGGEPTGQGAENSEPHMKLFLWLDTNGTNHFERWYTELLPRLQQAAYAKPPEALPIYYPTLADNKIDSVSIGVIGDLQPEGRNGLWSVIVNFLEVNRAKEAGGTPDGVSGGTYSEQQYKDKVLAEDAEEYQRLLDEQAQEEAERQQEEWEDEYQDYLDNWITEDEPDDDGNYQDLEYF